MNHGRRVAGISALFVALSLSISSIGAANEAIDNVSVCLTNSTSTNDRADLVKWIFVAMSKHPQLSALSGSTPEQDEAAIRRAGQLFTRLIADDCATQIRAMVAAHGEQSLSVAFEVLGRVAMQDLMTHPDVQAVFTGLDRYADQQRIDRVIQGGK